MSTEWLLPVAADETALLKTIPEVALPEPSLTKRAREATSTIRAQAMLSVDYVLH